MDFHRSDLLRNCSSFLALSLSSKHLERKMEGRARSRDFSGAFRSLLCYPLKIFVVQNFWKNGAADVHNLNTFKAAKDRRGDLQKRGDAILANFFTFSPHIWRSLNFDMDIVLAK